MRLMFVGISTFSLEAFGQDFVLHGNVIDRQTQESLPGVHVFISKENGTVSDIDGNFHLRVYLGDTIHYSMIGYESYVMYVTDTLRDQGVIISLQEKVLKLNDLEVTDYFQANTIIKNPPRTIYKIPGVKYPEINKEGKYLYLGNVFNPFYASLTMSRKDLKQHKKLFKEFDQKQDYDSDYEKAKTVFYEALETLDENFDEYYMVDFFNYTGLTVKGVANRTVYDLVKILPKALDRYFEHQKLVEEKRGEENFNTEE